MARFIEPSPIAISWLVVAVTGLALARIAGAATVVNCGLFGAAAGRHCAGLPWHRELWGRRGLALGLPG